MCPRLAVIVAVAALTAAACSEPEPETGTVDTSSSTTTTTAADTGPGDTATMDPPDPDSSFIVGRHGGQEWFLGTLPTEPAAADDSLEPIRIGMINQEDTPIGSFPELRYAADAAVNWINTELGGVDGRPLELIPCITQFSVEKSQSCAQQLVQAGVVALVGGIDVMSQGALPILEQNGIPVVGGIPAGLAEQRSPIAFSFSGGVAGGLAAFMQHAADNGAERAMIAFGEYDAFEVAADYGSAVGEHLGLDVRTVKFNLVAPDFLPVLNQAIEFGADAVVIAAADSACVSVMETFRELEIDGQLYLVGACATEQIIDAADGAHTGVVFNGEGPPNAADVEGTIYDEATDDYNEGPAKGAGTVGFRGMMNLYGVLTDLGGDNITSAAIIDSLRASADRESFWGHPYTCDGNQVPGLQALCAPQQTLFVMSVPGQVEFVTGWIDTPALFTASGVGQ